MAVANTTEGRCVVRGPPRLHRTTEVRHASGMLVFALALALADPAPPAPPRSVLVLDLVGSDVPASVPRLLSSLLAGEVARSGLKTLSQDEMRRVVALESEKAAMGCDTSSCLAEMASAMGVDYVVFGDVGKLGNAYIVTLRLFDSKRGDAVSRDTLQAADMDGVRQGVAASVSRLMAPIGVATATATATTATSRSPRSARARSRRSSQIPRELLGEGGGFFAELFDARRDARIGD